jgi:hygromycin-B 4-O-kinase
LTVAQSDGFEALDAEQVATFLAERLGGPIQHVERIERGEWSRAFFFSHGGREYVVRFGAHLEDFAKDRLAAGFRSPRLPVPAVLEIGEAFGGYFAISERLFGVYIDDVGEAQMRALLPSFFAMLDAMRTVDLRPTHGYGAWGADGQAPFTSGQAALLDVDQDRPTDRIAGWRARLAASPTGAAPFDEAYQQLETLAAYVPAERHLIHSDLLHYNVLVSDDRITGVFDWGCGLYGDFLYDLAWFCFWAPWFPAWDAIDFRREALRHYAAIGLAVPRFEERLRACQLHIGLAGQQYQAYKAYWSDLEATAKRTLAVARANV